MLKSCISLLTTIHAPSSCLQKRILKSFDGLQHLAYVVNLQLSCCTGDFFLFILCIAKIAVPTQKNADFGFVKIIEQRLLDNDYDKKTILFDPEDDVGVNWLDVITAFSSEKLPAPLKMTIKIQGITFPNYYLIYANKFKLIKSNF